MSRHRWQESARTEPKYMAELCDREVGSMAGPYKARPAMNFRDQRKNPLS